MTKPKAEHEKVGQGVGGGFDARVLTEKEIIQVESLAATLRIEQIADYFGISEQTFSRIKQRQPKVLEAYKKGRAKIINNIGDNLIQSALEGDAVRQMFFLKTQAGWKEAKEEQTTSTNINISGVEYQIPSNNKKKKIEE